MGKFHISPEVGEPRPCTAKNTCPYGSEAEHYASKEEAYASYETMQAKILIPIDQALLAKTYGQDAALNSLARQIRTVIADKTFVQAEKLLKNEYDINGRPFTGHCYVASEALYHKLGGKQAGWRPMNLRHEGSSHWYLEGPAGEIVDLTAEQFSQPPDYSQGVGRGFLTKDPSKRAQKVLAKIQSKPSLQGLIASGELKEPQQVAAFLQNKYPEIELVNFSKKSGDYYVLDGVRIKAAERKQGIGTKVMVDLCAIADAQDWKLALTPSTDWGATSKNRLKNFYKRFGFVENKGRHKDFTTMEAMVRPR